MDKIDEVKKILNSEPVMVYPSIEDAKRVIVERNDRFAQQICQLFEPKPDRLLTDDRLIEIWEQFDPEKPIPLADMLKTVVAEQRDLTASIKDKECQQKIEQAKREEGERIFNEINNRNLYILTKDCNNPSEEDWQALKGE